MNGGAWLDIIAELDEFKGAWRALSTLAPERLSALSPNVQMRPLRNV